jgi:hypothetical protein
VVVDRGVGLQLELGALGLAQPDDGLVRASVPAVEGRERADRRLVLLGRFVAVDRGELELDGAEPVEIALRGDLDPVLGVGLGGHLARRGDADVQPVGGIVDRDRDHAHVVAVGFVQGEPVRDGRRGALAVAVEHELQRARLGQVDAGPPGAGAVDRVGVRQGQVQVVGVGGDAGGHQAEGHQRDDQGLRAQLVDRVVSCHGSPPRRGRSPGRERPRGRFGDGERKRRWAGTRSP